MNIIKIIAISLNVLTIAGTIANIIILTKWERDIKAGRLYKGRARRKPWEWNSKYF